MGALLGYPPGPIGIIELGEHLRQNLGVQQLRGKILNRKDLGPAGRYLLHCFRFGDDLRF
jgi:hypothetical protein